MACSKGVNLNGSTPGLPLISRSSFSFDAGLRNWPSDLDVSNWGSRTRCGLKAQSRNHGRWIDARGGQTDLVLSLEVHRLDDGVGDSLDRHLLVLTD